MRHYTVDFTSRMKDINASLDQPADDDAAVEQKGALMDELLDIVDDIDHALGEEEGWLQYFSGGCCLRSPPVVDSNTENAGCESCCCNGHPG